MLACAPMRAAAQRGTVPAVAVAIVLCALLFSGGSSEAPLVWIGGAALVLAGVAAAAVAAGALPGPALSRSGLVFFGFPLHPPNRPSTKRADHLTNVSVPMLFLQGTRDTLADLTLLRPICAELGDRATLHIVESADHSFHVLKSAKRTDAQVLRELAETTAAWAGKLPAK